MIKLYDAKSPLCPRGHFIQSANPVGENPLKEYRRIVTEAKSEQVTKGIDNIILNRYIKWCLAEQALSQSIYKVGPVDIIRDEFYSNAQALQNIYGGQWQRYYKKRIVA